MQTETDTFYFNCALQSTNEGLPVKDIMGFCLQQDVQIHASADHLGRSFH